MIRLLITSFLCLPLAAVGQHYLIWSEGMNPVQYANIQFLSEDSDIIGGTYSDQSGKFLFSNVENLSRLYISHVNTKDTTIDLQNESDTTILTRSSVCLTEVPIFESEPRTTQIGVKPRLGGSANIWSLSGTEMVRYFRNDLKETAVLTSFSFYIKTQKPDGIAILKIVFYRNKNGFPGEKLPIEHLVELDSKSKKNIHVGLRELRVVLPLEGLFIGVEWVDFIKDGVSMVTSDESSLWPITINCNNSVKKEKQAASYVRVKYVDDVWHLTKSYFSPQGFGYEFDPIFQIEVSY